MINSSRKVFKLLRETRKNLEFRVRVFSVLLSRDINILLISGYDLN